MVRLRFSRSSPPRGGGVATATAVPAPLTAATPLRGNVPNNAGDGGVVRRGGANDNNGTPRGGAGGGGRANDIQSSRGRPASSGREDAKKRAKRVLALLDSPRKAIMSRTRSSRSFGAPHGGGDRRQQRSGGLGGRSASVPADLGGLAGGRRDPFGDGGGGGGGGGADRGHGNPGGAAPPARTQLQHQHHQQQHPPFPIRVASSAETGGGGGGSNYRQVSPGYYSSSLGASPSPSRAVARVSSERRGRSPSSSAAWGGYESSSPSPSPRGCGGYPVQQESPMPSPSPGAGRLKDDTVSVSVGAPNALGWLLEEAPHDIVPRVLSFAGSRKIDALSRTCKSWRAVALSEAVWRTACEDTGKWDPRRDGPITTTWLQRYRDNPLVPVDYDTIEAAFQVGTHDGASSAQRGEYAVDVDANNVRPTVPEHRRSVRVLLRPGRYVVNQSLVVHAVGDRRVTIETVNSPKGPSSGGGFWDEDFDEESDRAVGASASSSSLSTPSRLGRRATSIRNMLSCRYAANADVDAASVGGGGGVPGPGPYAYMEAVGTTTVAGMAASMPNLAMGDLAFRQEFGGSGGGHHRASALPLLLPPPKPVPTRAVIVIKTRKHNEPIFRVRQGTIHLRNLDLVHNASGTDIWNGNAAVQVQPPFDDQDNPLTASPPSLPPTAVLDGVDITSVSGRGIVNIDGGFATVRDCYIHNCAATGIYVGGPGSVANVERTDVIRNGNGNERSRRGIARGHSGVYLEQGVATLRDCNVSDNSLTGISAISADNATLTVEDSDLKGNGSIQLEMPPLGSASHRRSVSANNAVSAAGKGRCRSGLIPVTLEEMMEEAEAAVATGTPRRSPPSRGRPQSPVEDRAAAGVAPRVGDRLYATASARRRMRFAALEDEGNLGRADVAGVALVD